jgi:hypothetical protein
MKARSCCRKAAPRTAGGTLSAVLLVLMPKCPICLATYVSMVTGVGIGFTLARYLRFGLIAISLAGLIWLTGPLLRRYYFGWLYPRLRRIKFKKLN